MHGLGGLKGEGGLHVGGGGSVCVWVSGQDVGCWRGGRGLLGWGDLHGLFFSPFSLAWCFASGFVCTIAIVK